MMRKIILFVFLLVTILFSFAQEQASPPSPHDSAFLNSEEDELNTVDENGFAKEVLGDTSINFNDLLIKKDSVSAFKLKKDYRWTAYIDSFLQAQKKEASKESKITIKENNGDSFLSTFFNSGILQSFMWMIAAAVVLFIIYKLFLSEAVFGRRRAKPTVKLLEEEEDERLDNDYEVRLRKAYEDGNLRMAMRYLFLKTLQRLNEQELIKYTVDKTNSIYVSELPSAKKSDFASLALYYEYVWYGKVEIQKNIFDAIELKFNNFLNKI